MLEFFFDFNWLFFFFLISYCIVMLCFVYFREKPLQLSLFLVVIAMHYAAFLFYFGCKFIGTILIIIYVGALAVLFIFSYMLLDIQETVSYSIIRKEHNNFECLFIIGFLTFCEYYNMAFDMIIFEADLLRFIYEHNILNFYNEQSPTSDLLSVSNEIFLTGNLSIFFNLMYVLFFTMVASLNIILVNKS